MTSEGVRKPIFETTWISLWKDERGTVFVHMDDGIMIVPLMANGDVLFIREWSAAYSFPILSLPSGALEKGEDPAACANRELQEEIGYKAGKLDFLGEIYLDVKYVRCISHCYLGRNLEVSKLVGDEVEPIEIEPFPLANFEQLIADGRLKGGTEIAVLYMVRDLLAKEAV